MININGIDFTKNVQESTYKVDQQPVYTKWTDANGTNHREITRERVSGSFDLVFVEGMGHTYEEFLAAMKAATVRGVLTASFSVNNIAQDKTIDCFYMIAYDAPRKISEGRTFRKCKFTLEER